MPLSFVLLEDSEAVAVRMVHDQVTACEIAKKRILIKPASHELFYGPDHTSVITEAATYRTIRSRIHACPHVAVMKKHDRLIRFPDSMCPISVSSGQTIRTKPGKSVKSKPNDHCILRHIRSLK